MVAGSIASPSLLIWANKYRINAQYFGRWLGARCDVD